MYTFDDYDSGNCRVYYKDGKKLACIQDETSWGRPSFKFYACSKDGEPSHEIGSPFGDLAVEYERVKQNIDSGQEERSYYDR